MRLIALTISLALIMPVLVFAGWEEIFITNTGGTSFYVHSDSIKHENGSVKSIWAKMVKPESEKYMESLFYLDCKKKMFWVAAAKEYASDGSIEQSQDFRNRGERWLDIPPDSAVEDLWQFVCEGVRKNENENRQDKNYMYGF